MGTVRAYQQGDAEQLAPRLRQADVREVFAASGHRPYEALADAALRSDILCTIEGDSGQVAGMFGVSAVTDVSAVVWLLGSDDLVSGRLKKQFLKECRQWCDRFHSFRPLLFNCVDERNEAAIRWLKWMDFTFIKRHEAFGYEHMPFLEFVRLKHHV